MTEARVKVTNKGMISIPAEIRKKHDIVDGQYILVSEDDDGNIRLEPVKTVDAIRKNAPTVEEFKKFYLDSRKEDMRLER
ncbi:MAG TPA: AbrB/MazE/SpoVT family DNA-binding domain-containing protein [Candidatus Lokiarchaeia archaeon]|nr:AbrB/MazE/SpoVT family DNA-binding domain-containing protein [Candidatus Lokiarchaeia archaeon]